MCPSSSESNAASNVSAAAFRSASGASPSYMKAAMYPKVSERAYGDGWVVSTCTIRTVPRSTSASSSRRPGRS